jgi:integrase
MDILLTHSDMDGIFSVDIVRTRLEGAMPKLTDKIVAALPIPAKGNKRIPDSAERGLNAQVTAAGHRSFVLRYRIHGVERLYSIGPFPAWNIEAARKRARELRQLVDKDIDPHEEDARKRGEGVTLEAFWRRVYDPQHVVTKRPKWAHDIRSMMKHDILPRLGKRPVKAVDQADVAALHRAITKRAPARANRACAALSHLMNYAERPHVAEDGERVPALRPPYSNPCRGVARNFEEHRQRFLEPAEMARLADVLDRRQERDRVSVALVRFLLLTGCRFSEATHATWSQIDMGRGTWTKPSSHTKQKREHVVPLSAPALMLLQQMHEQNGSNDYLFPGPTGQPLSTIKTFWRSVTKQAELKGIRVHDLRHSFASILASGGASLVLIGQLLGHTQAATTHRYSHLVDSVQREAVERAAAVIGGKPLAEVVKLGRAG